MNPNTIFPVASLLAYALFSSDSLAETSTPNEEKLRLVSYDYKGHRTAEDIEAIKVYPLVGDSKLTLKFESPPTKSKYTQPFVFRFKTGNSNIGETKHKIHLSYKGKVVASRSRAKRNSWMNINVPVSALSDLTDLSISITCPKDALHIQHVNGKPLCEMILPLEDKQLPAIDKPAPQAPPVVRVAVVHDLRSKSKRKPVKENLIVSKAAKNKEELLRAFERIKSYELHKQYGNPQSFKIMQKLSASTFLVNGYRGLGGVDYSRIYHLVFPTKNDLVDDDHIGNIWVKNTGKNFTYNTTLGAKRTVRSLVVVTPHQLIQKDFLNRLKNGEKWILGSFRIEECIYCFGDGKLGRLRNFAACKKCYGKGSTRHDCMIQW